MMTWLMEEGAFILDRVRVWMLVELCSVLPRGIPCLDAELRGLTCFYNEPPLPHNLLEYS